MNTIESVPTSQPRIVKLDTRETSVGLVEGVPCPEKTLFLMATRRIYLHREEISRIVLKNQRDFLCEAIELAEAIVIIESLLQSNGVSTELEHIGPNYNTTHFQELIGLLRGDITQDKAFDKGMAAEVLHNFCQRRANNGGSYARNTGSRSSTKPAEIVEPGLEDGTYSGSTPISLTVFDHESDQQQAGCDITASEWRKLQALSKATRTPIGTILKRAVKAASNGSFTATK